jgi:hypothetical protein
MSSSENANNENDANAVLPTLLLEKSRQLYECAYQRFKTWCDEKKFKEAVTEKVPLVCFVNKVKP